MPTCPECDAYVTPHFVRVFSDNHGRIYKCPACDPTEKVDERAIAGLAPTHFYHSVRDQTDSDDS